MFFFFFKLKTAFEMRISDWSSDVCSSYLHFYQFEGAEQRHACQYDQADLNPAQCRKTQTLLKRCNPEDQDRPGQDKSQENAERHIVPENHLADMRTERPTGYNQATHRGDKSKQKESPSSFTPNRRTAFK